MFGYKTKSWKDIVTLFKHRIDKDKKKAPHKLFSSKSTRRRSSILLSNHFSFHVQHSDVKYIHTSLNQSNYTKVVTKHIQVSFRQPNVTRVFVRLFQAFYLTSFLLVLLYAWKSKSAIRGWRTRPTEEQDGPVRSVLCLRMKAKQNKKF